jgi:alkylation response protein AidB-like acyl-CoA dehydrogenase
MDINKIQEQLAGRGDRIAEQGKAADEGDRFSHENYETLKELKLFSGLVPAEFGGGGLGFADMAAVLRQLASYHPSTALSCSMHQHIVAANRYNHQQGRPGQALLEKVAANELVLVSTGAGDWLASSGELTAVAGGYHFSGMKHFASGSPAGNVLVTSAPYEDPKEGWQVLHFPVPLSAEGVVVMGNWQAMGMRGTGSNSVKLDKVFVPAEAIAARRPRGDYHMMWSVILPVALPLIMSVYLGVAETAAQRCRQRCKGNPSGDPSVPYLMGEMENALTTATLAVDSMVSIADEFNYQADFDTANEIVKRKTIAANSCQQTVAKAMEACSGQGFMRPNAIECLLRDVMASNFHPLQEKRQLLFSGSLSLGLEPPGQAF